MCVCLWEGEGKWKVITIGKCPGDVVERIMLDGFILVKRRVVEPRGGNRIELDTRVLVFLYGGPVD